MEKRSPERSKHYTKPILRSKRPTIPFIPSDRASRRVIAPYLNIVKKSKKVALKDEEDKYIESFLQKKPSIIMGTLKEFVDGMVELPILIHESIDALRATTSSIGSRLYLVDEVASEIFISPKDDPFPRNRLSFKIETGKSVAAHVAATQDVILSHDILVDTRFEHGIPHIDATVKSVLSAPILTAAGVCFGVVELYRDCGQKPFTKANTKIMLVVLGWIGTAIHRNNEKLKVLHQRQLNDCLIELTRTYFENNITIDKVINELVKFVKSSVNAERASLFIIRPENEMLADIYDQGLAEYGEEYVKRLDKVKFCKEKGIAAYVAKTKECVIIKDAYNDPRFHREVDQATGLITRSVLCVPILGVNRLLGIIQAINKTTGECFSKGDEELFKTFATYCGLSLQYNGMYKLYKEAKARYKTTEDLLRLRILPSDFEIKQIEDCHKITEELEYINTFEWYINLNYVDEMPQIAVYLIMSVADEGDIDEKQLYKFVLSMRRLYRNNPYHNWEHGFNVAHCMSTMLKRNKDIFTRIERKALVVAALGHDVDHGGVTNGFLHTTNHIMAELYSESTWEYHHYDITMLLLSEIPIYNNCSGEEYKEITSIIQAAILATDLVNYFKTSAKLRHIIEDNLFDINNSYHKTMLIGVMMTVSDLSGQCKPFSVTSRITMHLYEEFYNQGDIEKTLGLIPLSMMDREKKALIPNDQVNFMNILVLPCCDLVKRCLPNTVPLYRLAMELRDMWLSIINNDVPTMWSVNLDPKP